MLHRDAPLLFWGQHFELPRCGCCPSPVLLSKHMNMLQAERTGAGHAPAAFTCPLSKEILTEPVILAETGVTYQHDRIVEWFMK